MRRILEPHRNFMPEGGDGLAHGDSVAAGADYLHVSDYLRILIKRRWMIAIVTAAGLLAAAGHNWRATPIYEASARLLIEGDSNVLGLDRPVVDQRAWLGNFQPTQLSVLESTSLARRASDDLRRTADAATPTPSAGDIRGGLVVASIKDTRLVSVGFQSPDPALAARVANAVAQAYVAETDALRSTMVGQASDWLTTQVQEQRKLVQQSEAALQRYRQSHGADVLGENGGRQSIVMQKLGELQESVTRARADTIEKEAQASQVASIEAARQPIDTLPAIGSNSFIQGLKESSPACSRNWRRPRKTWENVTPRSSSCATPWRVRSGSCQLELSKTTAAIRNDRDAALARERALSEALERQKAAAQDLNAKAVEYTALEREPR